MTIKRLCVASSFLDGLPEPSMPKRFVRRPVSQLKTPEDALQYRAELIYFMKSIPKKDFLQISQEIGDRLDVLQGRIKYVDKGTTC